LKLSKGFRYNDDGHSDDYDSFVATDKKDIAALKRQIASKRWKAIDVDGTTHFHSPDKTIHVVVNKDRAAIFFRGTVWAPTPKSKPVKSSQIPVSYRITTGNLPPRNPMGTVLQRSATRRNGLVKYLPMQGWKLSQTVKSDNNTYCLFEKGGRTIAVNTGKDKFYDDVIVQ
jgi:hypothetical protein